MTTMQRPRSFWAVSGLGLVWNLFGLMSFWGWAFMSEVQLEQMTPEQVALYEATPGWLLYFFGCAVITGVIGAVLLIFRKKLSIPFLVVSLITAFIHQAYGIFFTDAINVYGSMWALVMPLFIVSIAFFLWSYARFCNLKGWLH